MAETIIVNEEVLEKEMNTVVDAAHKVLQAGLGMVALAQENMIKFAESTQDNVASLTGKLIKNGAALEKDGREALNELFASRRKQMNTAVEESQSGFETRVESILHGLNIPTRSDVEALDKKIATLTRKVNALSKELKTANPTG